MVELGDYYYVYTYPKEESGMNQGYSTKAKLKNQKWMFVEKSKVTPFVGWYADKTSPYYYSNTTDRPKMINNAKYIYTYLRAKGWAKESIWALLANMESEGGMNPAAWENARVMTDYTQSYWEGNKHYGGYGLVQWTPSAKYLTDNFYDGQSYSGFYKNSGHTGNCHTCMICQLERITFEPYVPSSQRQWNEKHPGRIAKANEFNIPSMTFQEFTQGMSQSDADVGRLAKAWCVWFEFPAITASELDLRVKRAVGDGIPNSYYPGWKNICNW